MRHLFSVFALFVIAALGAREAAAQEVEGDCRATTPAPDEAGGWGPIWETVNGRIVPIVRVYPFGAAVLSVETRVFLGHGTIIKHFQGPIETEGSVVTVPITLPSELSTTMALVTVIVTAVHPETGDSLAHSATRVVAWRIGENVMLKTEAEARALADGMGSSDGEVVEDGVVGREVIQ